MSFFPQLVAGPIERSERLLGELKTIEEKRNLWNIDRIRDGAVLMLWGYFQKMVVADRARLFVDTVYANYRTQGGAELVIATILFAFQIYCDFSGYSLIAMGAARIMGVRLMENFAAPYFSVSIGDFWRRWHISLSKWLRDYIYIPLGGSRHGRLNKWRNLMITFLASGVWHGAAWHFVAWGLLHGAMRTAEDIAKDPLKKLIHKLDINTKCGSFKLLRIIITNICVLITWVFFRALSLKAALVCLRRILTKFDPSVLCNGTLYKLGLDRVQMNILIVSIAVLFAVDARRSKRSEDIAAFLAGQNAWFRWACVFALFFGILIFGMYGPAYKPQDFIYFQF